MNKNKALLSILISFGLMPMLAAAGHDIRPATFTNSAGLWIAVVVGFVATGVILSNLRFLEGELAKSNLFIGIGILLIVIGFLAIVIPGVISDSLKEVIHDVGFILGHILILAGALKFKKIIGEVRKWRAKKM